MGPFGQANVGPLGRANVGPIGQANVGPLGRANVGPISQANEQAYVDPTLDQRMHVVWGHVFLCLQYQ